MANEPTTPIPGGEVRSHVEREAGVLVIEVDAPLSHNSLSLAMLGTIAVLLNGAMGCAGAVVLRGAGGTFCSGVDARVVRRALRAGWNDGFDELVDASYRALRALIDCPVPVVAAIDGVAAGAGATYALLADTRVVSTGARLLPGHLAAGAPLDGGSSYALGWLLGPARAMSVLLEGRAVSGADLHNWGFAGPTVKRDDLERRALRVAQRAASLDPESVQSARRLLRHSVHADFDDQWAAEVARLREVVDSGRLAANLDVFWASR